jgi:hypothetical protein
MVATRTRGEGPQGGGKSQSGQEFGKLQHRHHPFNRNCDNRYRDNWYLGLIFLIVNNNVIMINIIPATQLFAMKGPSYGYRK